MSKNFTQKHPFLLNIRLASIIAFALLLSLSLVTHSNKAFAHSIGFGILVNNEFLVQDYIGPDSENLSISDHYLSKNFDVNENINFKVILNRLGFDFELICKVDLSNQQVVNTRQYEINYGGIDLYYKGVEFDLVFNETGNYEIEISCTKPDQDTRIYFEENILISIGEKLRYPKSFLINNQEAKFRSVNEVSAEKEIVFAVNNPEDAYEYTWDIIGSELLIGESVKKSFKKSESSTFIILRVFDKESNLYEDNYFRIKPIAKVDESPRVEISSMGGLIVMAVGVILGLVIIIISVVRRFTISRER